jgi:acyl-coenzyme A thioesterase PaaI-like protein
MHAAAQFSLAEAASAECLQRQYGATIGPVFAVVRGAEVKYRRPATGGLLAYGEPDERTRAGFRAEMDGRGRTTAVILIDLKDQAGTLTFHGKFEWFISRVPPLPL